MKNQIKLIEKILDNLALDNPFFNVEFFKLLLKEQGIKLSK
jgi:hypothetical protein